MMRSGFPCLRVYRLYQARVIEVPVCCPHSAAKNCRNVRLCGTPLTQHIEQPWKGTCVPVSSQQRPCLCRRGREQYHIRLGHGLQETLRLILLCCRDVE